MRKKDDKVGNKKRKEREKEESEKKIGKVQILA